MICPRAFAISRRPLSTPAPRDTTTTTTTASRLRLPPKLSSGRPMTVPVLRAIELAPSAPLLLDPLAYWRWRRDYVKYWAPRSESVYRELRGQIASAETHAEARECLLITMALSEPLLSQHSSYLVREPSGFMLLSALDRVVGEPLDQGAIVELEMLQECNLGAYVSGPFPSLPPRRVCAAR